MCGLVGMAGDIGRSEKIAFRQMLIFDSVRGVHSTGVAAIAAKTNNVYTYKSVGDPFQLFRGSKTFSNGDGIYDGEPKILIGHNRFATVGKIIPANAHPFKAGDIVGAHNGTLSAWHLDKLEDHKSFDVDSEAIFHTINKVGHEEMLKRIHGAWALVWYNKQTQKLHFTRNADRPLYYCWSENHKTIFWASEEWMMDVALARAGIKHGPFKIFTTHKLFTIDLTDNVLIAKEVVESEELYKGFQWPTTTQVYYPEYGRGKNIWRKDTGTTKVHPFHVVDNELSLAEKNELAKMVGKTAEFYIGDVFKSEEGTNYLLCHFTNPQINYQIRLYSDGHPRHDEWVKASGDYTGVIKKIGYTVRKNEPYILLDMRSISDELPNQFWKNVLGNKDDNVKGYNGAILSKYEFEDAVSNGCCYCSTSITWEDRHKVIWYDAHSPVGVCCSTDKERMEHLRELFQTK